MNGLPPIKAEMIAALDQQRATSSAFVKNLPADQIIYGESGWTVKDIIIHLSALEADTITALHCAIAGEPFAVDLRGQDSVNDLYELRRREGAGRSWEQILDNWSRIRDRLRGIAIAFPADKLDLVFSTPFFQDYNLLGAIRACGAHERQHIKDIRAAHERQIP